MVLTLQKSITAIIALFLFTTSMALAAPLSAPSNVAVAAQSSSEINLAWTDNSNKEVGFSIERSTDGTNFSEVATVGENVEVYDDSGLSSNTTYYYQVRAYKLKRGNPVYGDYSNTDNDTTFDVVPASPSTLTAVVADNDIALSWTDNADNETGFKIERDSGSGFSQIATVGVNVTSYDDLNLADNTYTYRVRVYNAVGDSGYSNTDSAVVATVPVDPTNLGGFYASSTANIYWTDNADNENNYEVERGTDGVNFSLLSTESANITSYIDFAVTASTTYYYRVRATNGVGDSGYSNTTSVFVF